MRGCLGSSPRTIRTWENEGIGSSMTLGPGPSELGVPPGGNLPRKGENLSWEATAEEYLKAYRRVTRRAKTRGAAE